MNRLSKNEIKEIQLKILKSVHLFCTSRNIRYSLAYGTLLGAIRHKGYIPWDDDVDIMMPRPDYECFLKEYPGYNDYYTVQTYINDESYFLAFAKVYDNRTEQIIFPTKTGVFIDVFPVDGLPDSEEDAKRYSQIKLKLIFKDILYTCQNNDYRPGNKIFNSIKFFIKRLIVPNRQVTINRLKELYTSHPFEKSEYADIVVDYGPLRCRLKRNVFENYKTVPFESIEANIIENFDTFLKCRYGDYMQLPPEEERVAGHAAPVYWKED